MKLRYGAIADPGTSVAYKTGGWRTYRPIIDQERCIHCGICVVYCPEGIVEERDGIFEMDYDYCKGCGICANECPPHAIEMVLEEK
ncbi:MAG: pyruvate synthase subunit PorD [Candidatus Syntropharchaeia archaeon]